MTMTAARMPIRRRVPKQGGATQGASARDIDVRLVARSIAQAAVEVLAGTRPIQQLARSLDPDCYLALQHRTALTREHTARSHRARRVHMSPMVRSVRACRISDHVCEATVVVAEEQRCRAIALRLERREESWQVTALVIG
ncbi:Rv3235 family protein [Paenarthrobacter sp. NPDC089675]|uniref:Rv3235 family protein n=1 Tax=Paenarthrobacter sp. NPDC089675 TaxID=3364376 RepID=UPI00380B05D4